MICIWIMYTQQGSVDVLQVTGSLLLRILLWCLVVVCFLSCSKSLTVTKSSLGSLRRPVRSAGYRRSSCWLCTVTVYITGGTMVSGDGGGSWPRVDRSGVSFRCELQTSWNAHESYMNLKLPGVVELDTCRPGCPVSKGTLR